jgi:hypothetical protein
MRKLIVAMFCAVLALAVLGTAGCETRPDGKSYKYPSLDGSERPNSKIRQMGTDFLDDG